MLVFVYGTLKRKGSNYNVMKKMSAEFISTAKTVDKYPMYKDRYPYMEDVRGKGNNISGELFIIKDENKRILDEFEGTPDMYKSGNIEVITDKGIFVAITYFKATESSEQDLKNKKLISEYK